MRCLLKEVLYQTISYPIDFLLDSSSNNISGIYQIKIRKVDIFLYQYNVMFKSKQEHRLLTPHWLVPIKFLKNGSKLILTILLKTKKYVCQNDNILLHRVTAQFLRKTIKNFGNKAFLWMKKNKYFTQKLVKLFTLCNLIISHSMIYCIICI